MSFPFQPRPFCGSQLLSKSVGLWVVQHCHKTSKYLCRDPCSHFKCNSQERKLLKVPFIHRNKVLEIKGNFSFLFWFISLCSLLVTAIRASENVKQSAVCFAPRHFSSSEPAECFLLYLRTWRAGTHRCGHANLAWDVTASDFSVLLINHF